MNLLLTINTSIYNNIFYFLDGRHHSHSFGTPVFREARNLEEDRSVEEECCFFQAPYISGQEMLQEMYMFFKILLCLAIMMLIFYSINQDNIISLYCAVIMMLMVYYTTY